MASLFKNIKELIQVREESISFVSGKEMNVLPTIQNAFLVVTDGLITDFGSMVDCPTESNFEEVLDLTGKMILPSWCDSHTHIVYAGNREGEFADRISGMSYKEIADNGGGILNSAKKLQETTEDDLYQESKVRLEEVINLGTGAVEIKSGYGLTLDAELKMLRVIQRLKADYAVEIKATFLAAHAVPSDYKNRKDAYVEKITQEFIPEVAAQDLASFIDVFCETGYFSSSDTDKILKAGLEFGMEAKIHVNQFTIIQGVQIGVQNNARSVDHLELLDNNDIEALKGSKSMPVALPGCSYFLNIPYTPARKVIDGGLPLALATDYNPGSAPSGNMNFVVSAACIKMNMTPEEAINAATINGAYAMGLENKVGSITKGKRANFIVTKAINSYAFIPYSFGENCIENVFVKGEKIKF